MDRRSFLETLGNLGLLSAVGITCEKAITKGDVVDITMVGKGLVMERMSGFRLFTDVSTDRFGAEDESVERGFIREKGNRSHIPLTKVLEVVREGQGVEVRVETVSARGSEHNFHGDPGWLYADRTADEFGIMGSENGSARVFIPLSSVVRLLKKSKVL